MTTSTNLLHVPTPPATTPLATPETPATAVADKVARQSSFGLQAAGSIASCITTEWSTFFRGAKLFTGVAQHLARVGYGGIRGAQTMNNVPLLESSVAETVLAADTVLGGAKFTSLSELAERLSDRGEEILRPATQLATAKALEPLFSQAEKSFGHLMYALSVNSAKIAVLNRFIQLVALFENQTAPTVRAAANIVFETYLSLRILRQSLLSSSLVGKIVKLGTLLATCEFVHRASIAWKHLKQDADTAEIAKTNDPVIPGKLQWQAVFNRLSSQATATTDPKVQAIVDRVPAARTVFWIHRLISLATHPVSTGWSHALSLALAGTVGGALSTTQTA